MKFWYKFFFVILFLTATFFNSGCAKPKGMIFSETSQIIKTDIRESLKNEAMTSLRELVQRTSNKDSAQILLMLEKQSITVVPTKKGFNEEVFQKKDGLIKIVVLIPTDARYPFWYRILSEGTGFAYFFPKYNAIVLKKSSFSSLFSAIPLDHEGWHARCFQQKKCGEKVRDIFLAREERDAHEHGNELLSVVGEAPYEAFLQKEMMRMASFVKISNSVIHFPNPDETYSEELDTIFGPAKSQMEKRFRISFIWTDIVFHFIDAHHEGSREEKEEVKAQAILEAYRNAGIH